MSKKMKTQDKSIQTLKIKGTLELLVEKFGFERIHDVLMKLK